KDRLAVSYQALQPGARSAARALMRCRGMQYENETALREGTEMKPRTDMRKGAFAVVLAMVLSCGGVAAQGVDALNGVDPGRGFVWADRAYPAMDAEYARVGRPRGLAQVRSVALGQSREELQGIL